MTRDKAITFDEWVGEPSGWIMPDNPVYISNRVPAQINRRGWLMQQLCQSYLRSKYNGDTIQENERVEQIEAG